MKETWIWVLYFFSVTDINRRVEVGVLLKANSTCGVLLSALPCAGAEGCSGSLAALESFRSKRCQWESTTDVPMAKITLS